MRIRLRWDVSRCAGPGGIRLFRGEESGWAYAYVGPGYSMPRGPVTSLRHVYATPESVAAAADSLVRTGWPPAEAHGEEWSQAGAVCAAINAYRLR
ncbi:hypothetical protein [Streptomyces olivochromogenes]|uniref:Uncharacterized protein n=1 Tax=Streptomyces olivochromogenes TaxID=1963 RepID=A0A286PGM2_STROL|nr:hypothetical protein [Streptomyces olivochromogenes]KUN36001.1 hypothetical protein AQJ27_47525 [Streptomyces olivochromogenes]GAX58701.1 hypothetical protein SO3561_10276 [Streptomyces olivochromogenes]